MSVGVVTGVFGDDKWDELALKLAAPSVEAQTVKCEYILSRGKTLAEARNDGAKALDTEWIIFLDADDMLDSVYVESMLDDVDASGVRQPSTIGFYEDGSMDEQANLIPKKDLKFGNYLVIGSMCRREDFLAVGGFDPALLALEDWDLWLRMSKAGVTIGARPKAIYMVGVNQGSRNMDMNAQKVAYNLIRKKIKNA